ncbi:MAG: sigma-54 dependent transcriptional regulator [Deltaproteobacteria bacterium]
MMKGLNRIRGSSRVIGEVRNAVSIYATSDATVLIDGETGTGKEVVARALHDEGGRASGPFVTVDCGTIPESLFESEIFGHARGAFTGAAQARPGLVAAANRGTLFLDEIENLPLSQQGKILRLLQEREFRPVGAEYIRSADVRVVAATNRSLHTMVDAGQFRVDLLFRLEVLRLRVPPLRERLEDLEALLESLVARAGACPRTVYLAPSDAQFAKLRARSWPGNVRELANLVERAAALAPALGWAVAWHAAIVGARPGAQLSHFPAEWGMGRLVSEREQRQVARVRDALERNRWRREATARDLGISRVTLWRQMRRLGLEARAS